ncbi:basic proline-rich protein-like [Cervus elaphus]|uniref:basic proline-rich protein-like n=1 Tax=Cervus elaphus TaxID=9860 RepID=UPI001CC31423|nr:basic proline-rich protein-like [Cervus elaphus]
MLLLRLGGRPTPSTARAWPPALPGASYAGPSELGPSGRRVSPQAAGAAGTALHRRPGRGAPLPGHPAGGEASLSPPPPRAPRRPRLRSGAHSRGRAKERRRRPRCGLTGLSPGPLLPGGRSPFSSRDRDRLSMRGGGGGRPRPPPRPHRSALRTLGPPQLVHAVLLCAPRPSAPRAPPPPAPLHSLRNPAAPRSPPIPPHPSAPPQPRRAPPSPRPSNAPAPLRPRAPLMPRAPPSPRPSNAPRRPLPSAPRAGHSAGHERPLLPG